MSHNMNRIRQSPTSRVLHVINAGILLFLAVIMLYPMWDAVIVSISPAAYASRGGLKLWPAGGISLSAYEYVLSTNSVRIGYRNTIFRTVVGTSISMVMYFMAAYPLSKKVLPLRRFWSLYFLIPMFFSGGLIPEYLLVKSLGLLDNLWAYVLPCLMGTYNLLIVRNFISAIPDSLEESARVDGANFFVILFRIIIPLSLPVLATVALWVAVGHWNAWFDAQIYCRNKQLITLSKYLRETLITARDASSDSVSGAEAVVSRSVEGASIIVAIAPILCVYPFAQRYFVKGVMVGSVKG